MFNQKQVNKVTKKVMKTINTKLVLYVLVFLSVVSLSGQLFAKNFSYIGSFVALAVVTGYFTKSMSAILLVPLVVVNILVSGNYLREGMKSGMSISEMQKMLKQKQQELKEEMKKEMKDEKKIRKLMETIKKHKAKIAMKKKQMKEGMENDITNGQKEVEKDTKMKKKSSDMEEDAMMMDEDGMEMEEEGEMEDDSMMMEEGEEMEEGAEEEMEEGEDMMMKGQDMMKMIMNDKMKNAKPLRDGFRPKKRMVHRGKPKYLKEDKDSDEAVGESIDYASTLEQAYGNLQKMMGKGGMKGLTKETTKLVSQQKELMDSLKSMAPVLNDAQQTLKGFNIPDMGEIKKMMGSFTQKN